MEASPAPSDANETTTANRRTSGRITKKPIKLAETYGEGSTKRKRATNTEADDAADSDGSSDGESEEDEDVQDDVEHIAPKRKARKTGSGNERHSRLKANEINGATTDLSIRVATAKGAGGTKGKRVRKSAVGEAEGLYAQVFGQDEDLDIIAAQWLGDFKKHESKALADFVNFVLRCAGCEYPVTSDDIEDPDNCANRLIDIQDQFQSHDIIDYPLIARSKGAFSFRKTLNGFVYALVKKIGEADLLHDQTELIDNIQVWIGTMSSAATRPFRHTSAIVSLSVISALCEIGRTLVENRAKFLRQGEGERKKGRMNKGRVSDLQKKADEIAERKVKLDTIIKEWFDVVFVHRYRDVDPKIRVDCVNYLSHWIVTYPDMFFDDQHLRYLGWVLSDSNSGTRHEVVKQLQKLFNDKDKITGLKQFTERFRPRLIEMAARDGEANVRASTIELLDTLRDAGLLEPNDIDAVGRLIFDIEPKVRKAVVQFFASNINDMFELKIEDLGGQEAIDEFPGSPANLNVNSPRLEWLKFKSLAEVLWSYDSQDDYDIEPKTSIANFLSVGSNVESRFGLAAEVLIEHIEFIELWEILAAYLLYDHSQSSAKSAVNAKTAFLQACKLEEKEESILLEVLNVSAKVGLTKAMEAAPEKKSKKPKAPKHQVEEHEEAAQHLVTIIPKLLTKYGSTPESATAVLRLERVLNLDLIQDLRQNSTSYATLLETVKRQFMNHDNQDVLAEASLALLHAKNFEDFEELTDDQLQIIWEDTTHALATLCHSQTLTSRGNIQKSNLSTLANAVLRISHLASISSCVEPLEAMKTIKPDKSRKKQQQSPPVACISLLIELVNRGVPGKSIDAELDSIEDILAINAIKCLQFYFMWKVRDLQMSIASRTAISDTNIEKIAQHRDATFAALRAVLRHRHGIDDVRLAAAGSLVELSSLFTSLRHVKSSKPTSSGPMRGHYLVLIQKLDPSAQALILQTFIAAEAAFAKKTHRTLEAPAFDDEPEGSDDDESSPIYVGNDAVAAADGTDTTTSGLLAEERLCTLSSKIAIAIIAGVIPTEAGTDGHNEQEGKSLQKRLLRNKTKLGNNFKEICNFLENGGTTERKRGANVFKSKTDDNASKKLKSAEVVEGSDEEDAGDAEIRGEELIVDDDMENEDVTMQIPDDMESLLGD